MRGLARSPIKGLINVTRKAPGFVAKHPVLSTGVAATAYGANELLEQGSPAERVENRIMRARTGSGKYACEELSLLDERKQFLQTKTAFEKTASEPFNPGEATAEYGIMEGLKGLRNLIGLTALKIKDKVSDDPKRKRILSDIQTSDPIVSEFEKQQPGGTLAAMDTMRQYAPTLSTNPAMVQSFLRNSAMTGGPMDHNMIRGLADAERSVLDAQKARNSLWTGGR